MRWFEQSPVPAHLIDKALEAASYAPSACNRQPFEYRIFTNSKLVSRLSALPPGISGYEHNIPALAVLIGKMEAFHHTRDRHLIYIDASLSAMAFMYALETIGLSSCPINWPDIPKLDSEASRMLHLDNGSRIVMFIAIGFPDRNAKVPRSEKISLDHLRTYNRLQVT